MRQASFTGQVWLIYSYLFEINYEIYIGSP